MADDKKTPVTDDQELAKVLQSMNEQAAATGPQVAPASPSPTPGSAPTSDGSGIVEDIPPIPATLPSGPPAAAATPTPAAAIPAPSASTTNPAPLPTPAAPGALEDIKRQALEELRPIVSKLDLPAEEKFDALLLVIRSSDDQSLVQAAYQAAEGIADEAKKAQALLDIVKEIEYFSSQGKMPQA